MGIVKSHDSDVQSQTHTDTHTRTPTHTHTHAVFQQIWKPQKGVHLRLSWLKEYYVDIFVALLHPTQWTFTEEFVPLL